jgi:hypothetical protein
VESRPDLVRDRGERADVLHRADLVVGVGDRDERGVRSERGAQGVRRHGAVRLDREHRHREAVEACQVPAALEDGLVLDRTRDDVASAGCGERDALDRGVRPLGAAAGEHDLTRTAPERSGDDGPRRRQAPGGGVPDAVGRGRVAERPGQVRPHRLEDLAADGCGGGAVQVEHGRLRR